MQWGPLDENRIGQLGWEFTKLEAQVCAQAAQDDSLSVKAVVEVKLNTGLKAFDIEQN